MNPASSSAAVRRGQGEWILVADDEKAVREILDKMLCRFGYHVITAADGAAAVALYSHDDPRIAVVLLDMVMDGPATIRALRKINPTVKVITMSGAGEACQAHQPPGAPHLSKPCTAEMLLNTLHSVLQRTTQRTL